MPNYIEKIARNLRKPSSGFYGQIVRGVFISNKIQEKTCVELLKIQPHHNVLEVGFGPGHGINYVFKGGFRKGPGKIYGVDFSSTMCESVEKRFSSDVSSGKLTILNEDVARMSIPDCTFDRVFYTNCHFFWPDLEKACLELHRVMKPDAKMITVMNVMKLQKVQKLGYLSYATDLDPDSYLDALKNTGFVNVKNTEVKRGFFNDKLNALTCEKP